MRNILILVWGLLGASATVVAQSKKEERFNIQKDHFFGDMRSFDSLTLLSTDSMGVEAWNFFKRGAFVSQKIKNVSHTLSFSGHEQSAEDTVSCVLYYQKEDKDRMARYLQKNGLSEIYRMNPDIIYFNFLNVKPILRRYHIVMHADMHFWMKYNYVYPSWYSEKEKIILGEYLAMTVSWHMTLEHLPPNIRAAYMDLVQACGGYTALSFSEKKKVREKVDDFVDLLTEIDKEFASISKPAILDVAIVEAISSRISRFEDEYLWFNTVGTFLVVNGYIDYPKRS